MHLLIAFLIGTAFLGGYFPVSKTPDKSINLAMETNNIHIRAIVDPFTEIANARTIKQEYDYSCGSAALATLLDFYLGEEFSEKQVISGLLSYGNKALIVKRRAFSFLDMKKFVDALGYKGAGYKAELIDLKTLNAPGIVPIRILGYKHFTVFKGVYKGHVFVSDPWKGNISFTEEEFKKIWDGNVIFMIHTEGKPVHNLLTLRNEDLRIVDEDLIRRDMFIPVSNSDHPGFIRSFETKAGTGVVYKR